MQEFSYDPKKPAWGRFRVAEHIHLNPDNANPGLHRIIFEVPDDYPKTPYATICAWSRARSQNVEFEASSVGEAGPEVSYWPGSILNVQPVLPSAVVDGLLDAMQCDGDRTVDVGGASMSLREAVSTRFDNSGPIKQAFLKPLAELAPDSKLLTQLKAANRHEKALFGTTLDVLNALREECGVCLPVDAMLKACKRPISPRRYTIASHCLRDERIELVVVEANTEMPGGRLDRGICSAMLTDAKVGDIYDCQVMVKPDYPPVEAETRTLFLFGRGSGYSGLPHFAWDALDHGHAETIVLATGGTTIRELANLEELEALGQRGVIVVAGLREPQSADAYLREHPQSKIHFVGKAIEHTMAVPGVTEAFMAAMRGGEARICGGPGPTGALTDWLIGHGEIELYPEAREMYDKYQPVGPHKGDKAKALRRHCMKAMELGDEYRGKVFVDVF